MRSIKIRIIGKAVVIGTVSKYHIARTRNDRILSITTDDCRMCGTGVKTHCIIAVTSKDKAVIAGTHLVIAVAGINRIGLMRYDAVITNTGEDEVIIMCLDGIVVKPRIICNGISEVSGRAINRVAVICRDIVIA